MSRTRAIARLESEFLHAGLPEGTVLPSARKLAQRWGLDFSTVARAIRELTAAGCLVRTGPHRVQTRSAPGRLGAIHVLDSFSAAIEEARDVASLFGISCLAIPGSDITRVDAAVLEALAKGAAGLLLWPGSVDDAVLRRAHSGNVPVVVCDVLRPGVSSVLGNNREIGRLAAMHLIELGHRDLMFVTPDPAAYAVREERLRGFLDACRESGLSPDAAVGRAADAGDVGRLLRENVGGHRKVTGWIAATDELALHIADSLARAGIVVGRDAAVVSCQDSPACASHTPPLSAVAVGNREVARIAAMVLVKQIQVFAAKGIMGEPIEVLVQPRLRARPSSGPAPGVSPTPHPAKTKTLARQWIGLSPEERRAKISGILSLKHPWLRGRGPRAAVPVPLDRFFNQRRARYHQWLGGKPLLHLPGGLHRFHGIPYLVAAEGQAPGGDVVVMRNPQYHRGKKVLAQAVRIPVEGSCRALALLIAAGSAGQRETLADAIFRPHGGRAETHPIRCAGPDGDAEAEVQDWWPTSRHADNARAMGVPITDNGDPLGYERFLYSWLWPLSRRWPEGGILELIFRADSHAALALLALTRFR